jgi:molybdate transport system substrate-binding protein
MKDRILPVLAVMAMVFAPLAHAEKFTIAAASDLRFALDEIAEIYREQHPDHGFEIIYGSSGKMTTQIMNGAPYDVFFSADIAFPERLQAAGFAATDPEVYAIGRIVIWSNTLDASELRLEDLSTDPRIRRIAIAQPSHAPYGLRAQEAMESAGVWEAVQRRLVFGENIAHTAQMVESGAANVGIIALSLARFPAMAKHPYHLIDARLHKPLTQAYIVTRRAENNEAARTFARHMATDEAHEIMERYGFVMPDRDANR